MEKEQMHAIVDAWPGHWPTRAIVHALIDLGRVTTFDCAVERCILPTRKIDMTAVTTRDVRPRDALQLDHKVSQFDGGDDRVENIRISHYACNVARAFHGKPKDRSSADASAATRAAQGSVLLTCNGCGAQCRGQNGLKGHIRQAGCGGTVPEIKCEKCGRVFRTQYRLDEHAGSLACLRAQRATSKQVEIAS